MELEPVFDHVARRLGAELIGFHKLEGGSSANVWRLDLIHGGQDWPVVFREHQPGEIKVGDLDNPGALGDAGAAIARKEYHLLQRLGELNFPIAAPLYLDDTNRFLVTEFVVGDPFVDPSEVTSALDQMVDLLVRLHRLDVQSLEGVELTAPEDPIARLSTCLPESDSGSQLGSLLKDRSIRVHSNPAVLIHGDYWPGNVLWADGKLAALIDWEDAWLGDPLADLACARVELLCQYGHGAMEYFTHRYLDSETQLDTWSLPGWECYVSATALASMHLWGLDPAEETRRRSLTESFFNRAVARLKNSQSP